MTKSDISAEEKTKTLQESWEPRRRGRVLPGHFTQKYKEADIQLTYTQALWEYLARYYNVSVPSHIAKLHFIFLMHYKLFMNVLVSLCAFIIGI